MICPTPAPAAWLGRAQADPAARIMDKPRVLMVEDEPGIADVIICYTLQSSSFASKIAASSSQALALFATARPI